MCRAQDGGGVDNTVAHRLAVLIFGPFHCLHLGHIVRKLSWTGEQRLDIMLDRCLSERVDLADGGIKWTDSRYKLFKPWFEFCGY